MLLTLGPAYGEPTESRGNGIAAGCGRPGGAAKAYSRSALDYLRIWIKDWLKCDNSVDTSTPSPEGPPVPLAPSSGPTPAGPHCGLKTETFVHDTTMILWAKHKLNGPSDLAHLSYEVSNKWTGLVVGCLKLQTSDNKGFLPPGLAVEAALAGCCVHHCAAEIVDQERGLGIDTVATGKRNQSILRNRADDAVGRAERNVFVINTVASTGAGIQYVRETQMMARQGIDPSQVYGNSAIGASPAITSKQKSNLAMASGAMGNGSSRTIASHWTFGADALPDVNNPMSVIQAWLRLPTPERSLLRPLPKLGAHAMPMFSMTSSTTRITSGRVARQPCRLRYSTSCSCIPSPLGLHVGSETILTTSP